MCSNKNGNSKGLKWCLLKNIKPKTIVKNHVARRQMYFEYIFKYYFRELTHLQTQ